MAISGALLANFNPMVVSYIMILKVIGMSVYALVLLALGTYCLARLRRVQEWVLKRLTSGSKTKLAAFTAKLAVEHVRSDSYLTELRVSGVTAYLMALIPLVGYLRAWLGGHPHP